MTRRKPTKTKHEKQGEIRMTNTERQVTHRTGREKETFNGFPKG
jgi:hypothetical protein